MTAVEHALLTLVPPPPPRPMVRAAVVAKALGVSQRTLLNWARDRGFPRPDYGKLFLDDVRCWLESQRAKAEAAHVG